MRMDRPFEGRARLVGKASASDSDTAALAAALLVDAFPFALVGFGFRFRLEVAGRGGTRWIHNRSASERNKSQSEIDKYAGREKQHLRPMSQYALVFAS